MNPIRRFGKSLKCASSGIFYTFKSERHFKFHVFATLVVVGFALYLRISTLEWGLVIFAIGFVLVAELFNTALERLGDEAASGRQREFIRHAKDTSAGAVLVSAITAIVIGILIILIPLIHIISP